MSTLKAIKLQNPSGESSNIDLGTGGEVLIGSATTTGTASQTLQVIGGAYVSGNVGVGATNPNTKLDCRGDATIISSSTSALLIKDNPPDSTGLKLYSDASGVSVINGGYGTLVLQTGNTERVRVDSSGNLGIGTASPISALDVVRSTESIIGIKNTGAGSAWVAFTPGSSGGAYLHNTTNSPMVFTTNGTEKLRIASNGDINMGSASNPGDTLRYFDIYNTNTGNSAGSILRLITNNSTNTGVTSADIVLYRTGNLNIINNQSSGNVLLGTAGGEKARITSGGYFKASNNSTYFGVGASIHEFRQTTTADNLYVTCTNASYASVSNVHNISRSANLSYAFFFGYSGGGGDLEFNLRGDGNAYADGSWFNGGADYAEMFEWEDGNPDNEDRRGYSVSLVGNKIQIAQEGDEIIGVISGNPSVIGDTAWNKWGEKYLRDDFGSYITETHNVVEWTDEDGKEHSYEDWNLPEGIVVPNDATIKTHDDKGNPFTHRKLNPEYNPDLEYVSREDRPEWDAVGMMGKLRLRKGQPVRNTWIKMRDISESVEEWLVR